MNPELKYIIYCRKSSESKDKQALSIEAQRRELLDFAKKEKLKIIELFEESQSAYKVGRPIFDNVMRIIETGEANALLTWKPDRLARNALDGGRVIQAMDDNHLQEIRTPYEIFRQSDNRMMVYIHFGMSNDYSRQISANVKRGNRQKYTRGEFVGRAPLGYLNAKVGISNNIIPDPEKASVVRRLFETYATGDYSIQDIANMADSLGLKSVNGIKIPKSGMYKILRLPAYYGLYQHGGEFHQGSYEPLISKELFDRVQYVIEDRNKPKTKTWTQLYRGLIRCAECGCQITTSTKIKDYKQTHRTASYTYYHCTKKRGFCSQKPVRARDLEKMIENNVLKIQIDKEVWDLGVELLKARNHDELAKGFELRKKFQKEYDHIEGEMEKLLQLRLDDEITPDEYAIGKKALLNKRNDLKGKLEDREHTSSNWLELAENFFETAYRARNVIETGSDELKRNLVKAVGSNLLLRDKNIEFSFRKPYDVLLKPEVRDDVQGLVNYVRDFFWEIRSFDPVINFALF